MRVDDSARSGGIIRISLIFYNMKYVMCSHLNRLIEVIQMSTHNIPVFNIKKKITLNYPKSTAKGFSEALKNEFETAVVN